VAPPDHLAGLRGPTSKERGRGEKRRERGRLAVDMDIHGYIHGYIHVWI